MARGPRLYITAAVTIAAAVVTACSGGKGRTAPATTAPATTTSLAPTPTRQVVVHPLFVTTDARGQPNGATETVRVTMRPSADGKLRVVFRENGAPGADPQWRAAGWGAVTAATLLTGVTIDDREFDFTVAGHGDGSSAGALLAIAVIALMRGDQLAPDITLTGSINPDGSIGPVSGIPDQPGGVVAAHQRRLLVPEGERSSENKPGRMVDVVEAGQRLGVEVSQTRSVYDAYPRFTGAALPRRPVPTSTRLAESAYEKIRPRVDAWSAQYRAARGDFNELPPVARQELTPYSTAATQHAKRAATLTREGLDAGAFAEAINAGALMNAAAQVGQSFPILLTQGAQPFVAKIKAGAAVPRTVSRLVAKLKSFKPKTVSDAAALVAAYGKAIDAVSFSRLAQHLFDTKAPSAQAAVATAEQGAIYYELAGSLVDAADDIFSVGQGLGGSALVASANPTEIASLFRHAAEADLQAFRSAVLAPRGPAREQSAAARGEALAAADSDYALALTGDELLDALPSYFAGGASSAYAALGGAVSLLTRTAELTAKYSPLGQVDPRTLALTGLANDHAFDAALQVAGNQLRANFGGLRSKHVNPTIVAADNEIAGVDQNGDVTDEFDALGDYWSGYLNSRALAYLGGFPEIR